MATPAGKMPFFDWQKYVPTAAPTNRSATAPFWKRLVPTMPPTPNITDPAAALKDYLRDLGIPAEGNETDPESMMNHMKRVLKKFKGAPLAPEACNTTHQLKEWRKSALAFFKASAP